MHSCVLARTGVRCDLCITYALAGDECDNRAIRVIPYDTLLHVCFILSLRDWYRGHDVRAQ